MPFYKSLGYEENRNFAPRAVDRLVALREQLRTEIPARTLRDTLLLATWNIRDFDSNKFRQGPRLEETYYYIAEVIAAFDLVAVQEVNDDLGPLERVMDILGPNWDFITTDVTEGVSGNGERTAFVFDTRKVLFRNVAGEIVLPMGQAIGGAETIRLPKAHKIEFTEDGTVTLPDGSQVSVAKGQSFELPPKHKVHLPQGQKIAKLKQFARTPFLVAFQAGWFKFSLCTVHLYFGSKSGAKFRRRVKEIGKIAGFLSHRSDAIREREQRGENFILLGDFNIVDAEDDTFKALTDNGFTVPQPLHKSNVAKTKFYDQIAFRVREKELKLGPSEPNSGVFRFFNSVFRDGDEDYRVYHDLMENTAVRDIHDSGSKKGQPRNEEAKKKYYRKKWRTWQISDHEPLWVELKIDFTEDYLARVRAETTPE